MSLFNAKNNINNLNNLLKKLFALLPSNLNEDLFLPYMRASYRLQLGETYQSITTDHHKMHISPQITTKCIDQGCKPS